jgi:hypothetical protein
MAHNIIGLLGTGGAAVFLKDEVVAVESVHTQRPLVELCDAHRLPYGTRTGKRAMKSKMCSEGNCLLR